MRPWIITAAAGLLLMAGCGGSREPVTSGWTEPSHYGYTLRSSCGEQLLHGTMRLTVKDGKVINAAGLDEPGQNTVSVAKLENLPSLKDLVNYYESAVRDGADKATAEFDPGDGHPTHIDLDPERNAMDDELCFWVSDYQLLS